MENRSLDDVEWNRRLFQATAMGSLNLCGFVLTCFTLVLTFKTDLKAQNVRYMLANLVLACLLHTFMFVIPQNAFVLYRERLAEEGCSWLGIVFFILALQMIVFPPFLAVNRYIALHDTERYKRVFTPRHTIVMILVSWIFSIGVASTFRLGGKSGYDFDNDHCCIVVKDSYNWTIYYCFVILLPLICLCDGTMLFCNFKIYKKLRTHSATNSLAKNVVSENKEILYFLIAETLIPLCFHTIYHLAKVIYVDRQNTIVILLLPAFYSLNATARCLSILFFLRPYRKAFEEMIGCKKTPKIVLEQMKPVDKTSLLAKDEDVG